MNISDAIKEGDGKRLFRCFKIALPFFYQYNHTKYAYVLLLFIAKITAILSEKESFHLLHNRFYNRNGLPGTNIPLDLRMEQINLICKTCLKSVGSNFTKKSAYRISRCETFVEKVVEAVDADCSNDNKPSGYHGITGEKDAVEIIVKDLTKDKVFTIDKKRKGYPSFKKFNANLLQKFDYRDFCSWATKLFKVWEAMYEN